MGTSFLFFSLLFFSSLIFSCSIFFFSLPSQAENQRSGEWMASFSCLYFFFFSWLLGAHHLVLFYFCVCHTVAPAERVGHVALLRCSFVIDIVKNNSRCEVEEKEGKINISRLLCRWMATRQSLACVQCVRAMQQCKLWLSTTSSWSGPIASILPLLLLQLSTQNSNNKKRSEKS